MLKQISLVLQNAESADSIVFKIKGATPKDRYILREVTGLTPPEKNLFISDLARDGAVYQGRRVGTRNVVFTFDLNPNPSLGETVTQLRDKVQKLVMGGVGSSGAETHIRILLEYENKPPRYTDGWLETFEAGLFTEENLVQLSILCPDPYLHGSEVVISKDPGYITMPLNYVGTADTGFEALIQIETNSASKLSLAVDEQTMEFDFQGPLQKNSLIEINTTVGEQSTKITTSAGVFNLLPVLNPRSRWLRIGPHTSTTSVFGENPGNFVASIKQFTYKPSYWGL